MLEELRKAVYEANLELPRRGLVTYTWGNVSGIDRSKGLMVIKPSGAEYSALRPEDLVVLDMNGNSVEGALHPSSDAKTHLELYRAFPEIGGVVHTHSVHAVAWAQAGRDIPCYGTTHADYFYGPVPCARALTGAEVEEDYEKNTGTVIVETFRARDIDPVHVPGVICRSHGPFAWAFLKNLNQRNDKRVTAAEALSQHSVFDRTVVGSRIGFGLWPIDAQKLKRQLAIADLKNFRIRMIHKRNFSCLVRDGQHQCQLVGGVEIVAKYQLLNRKQKVFD